VTPERWQQVKDVVGRALETAPGAARDALIDAACAGDPELRDEVVSLLAAAEIADSLPGARDAVAAEAVALDRYRRSGLNADPDLRAVLEGALGRQYDILLPLGRGGMGAVYLARERALERFVAIKVLRPDLSASPEGRERFRREARIAAQLAHPGILPLHTFGEVPVGPADSERREGLGSSYVYFVMGYVRGESLAARLAREGALPPGEARRILAELADALDCAHRHGVVHRDIKPANVLLDADGGRAVLADFGIARLLGADDSLTTTGAVVGTPHFMSPEQAAGAADVDARSDLWSLGAVGYMMLAGREPFVGENAADLAYQRLALDVPPLRGIAPSVPPALEAVVMRCLVREPALRWQDARSLREALQSVDDDAAALPESVRGLPGFGPYAIVWAVGWSVLATRAPAGSIDHVLLLIIAIIVPVGLALHVWNTGRNGLSTSQLARVACWPPEWWGMWWPSALRRPGDLWSRLPRPARGVRLVLSAFILGLPTLILVRRLPAADPPAIDAALGIAKGGLFVLSALAVLAALAWARRQRLALGEALHLLFGATAPSPAWRAPRLTALLEPAIVGVRPPDFDSPGDLARAIAELHPMMPPDASAVAANAMRLSQRLQAAIALADRQIAALARDASDTELDRLSARLAALGEPTAPDIAERSALRALVTEQLALVRRLKGRHEVACRERAQWLDEMRAVWQGMTMTYHAARLGGDAVTHAATRLRSRCAVVEELLDRNAPAITPGPPTSPRAGAAVSYSPMTGPR
jgi:serine/threonine-protein kinase